MTVRPATINDYMAIAQIHHDCWTVNYKGHIDQEYLDSLDFDQRAKRWKEIIENEQDKFFLVFEENGTINGFGEYKLQTPEDCESEITALYVSPNHQNKGIGAIIFNHLKESLVQAGKKQTIVETLKTKTQSRSFYEKMGGMLHGKGNYERAGIKYDTVFYLFNL